MAERHVSLLHTYKSFKNLLLLLDVFVTKSSTYEKCLIFDLQELSDVTRALRPLRDLGDVHCHVCVVLGLSADSEHLAPDLAVAVIHG